MKFDTIEAAIKDIRAGKMVVVVDDEDRENEGDLVAAGEMVTADMVNFMAKEGRGLICTPLSNSLADRFDLWPVSVKGFDMNRCNFTVSIDLKEGVTTGISASDRYKTIKALTTEETKADGFNRPGHIFPIRAHDGGVLVRAGHSEAAVDLAVLAGLQPVGVICEIVKENGEMARVPDLMEYVQKFDLKIITIKDLIEFRRKNELLIKLVAKSEMPTEYGDFTMHVYENSLDGKDHVALVKGDVESADDVLVRVHSECFTGDILGSKRCDCGEQLSLALKNISEAGVGVLLYMRQEGRGIGLANKIKAYDLQDQGYDTVEANRMLGFQDDLREYGVGAQILADLGVTSMRLMTNNPRKIVGLEGYGLKIIERVQLELKPNEVNKGYLSTKKAKLGHYLRHV